MTRADLMRLIDLLADFCDRCSPTQEEFTATVTLQEGIERRMSNAARARMEGDE